MKGILSFADWLKVIAMSTYTDITDISMSIQNDCGLFALTD